MSLVSELKRRNVFRAALAYLAASWLLVQVVETVFPLFGLSDSAARMVVVLLGIGLIPVLIISWVFELTREGWKRDSELGPGESTSLATGKMLDRAIMIALTMAIVYFAIDKFVFTELRLESARQEGRSEALLEAYGDKSIAVLPFADMSPAGDQEYMSDGIAEELLNLLTGISELRVISRSSAFSFKGKEIDIPTIAERLNVAYVLEGSVRKAGDTVRITAQLVEARSDTHLWSETYDRELNDIFAIQDEIAESVVDKLEVTLLGEGPKVRQTAPEAYALFLQARYLHEQPAGDSFVRAFDFYKAALEIDENYVPAWVWLAALYDDTVNSSGLPYDEVDRLAHEAIERALAIDPNDPMALGMSAIIVEAWDHDLATASARMQRALELDPNNPILMRWAAIVMSSLGQYKEQVRINEYLFARDPVGHIAKINLASTYLNNGQFDEAIELCKIQVALQTEDGPCRYRLALAYLYSGNAEAALEQFDHLSLRSRSRLAPMVYHALGRQEDFASAFAELQDKYETGDKRTANLIALVHAFIGNVDSAFAWLERALDDGVLDVSPDSNRYKNLHDDPRWDALMDKAGMSREALDAIKLNVNIPD